jgi:hypothetical protein
MGGPGGRTPVTCLFETQLTWRKVWQAQSELTSDLQVEGLVRETCGALAVLRRGFSSCKYGEGEALGCRVGEAVPSELAEGPGPGCRG